jgi:hypothetical protein
MFTGKIQEVVSEYSSSCIDLRADEVLISAESGVGWLMARRLAQSIW